MAYSIASILCFPPSIKFNGDHMFYTFLPINSSLISVVVVVQQGVAQLLQCTGNSFRVFEPRRISRAKQCAISFHGGFFEWAARLPRRCCSFEMKNQFIKPNKDFNGFVACVGIDVFRSTTHMCIVEFSLILINRPIYLILSSVSSHFR
jgi:hypothetical protein